MSYIGNTLQVAYPSYTNIDDISGSFNGVTTSFALTVGGVAPVPAPLSSNQCMISVGGVIQRPDDTGTEGFRLSGGNIVFSSAPNTGEDFFGVILAGADYVNVGVNYPSGSASTPSITFDSDLDTGLYNPAANELGITTAGTSRLVVDSSGNVNIDSNTLYVDAVNNRVGVGTTSPQSEFVVSASGGVGFEVDLDAGTSINQLLHYNRSGSAYVSCRNNALDHRFEISGSEKARLDSSGRLLVGTSTSPTGNNGQYAKLVVQGQPADPTGGANISIQKGEAATNITSGEGIGNINWSDSAGNTFVVIGCEADANAGAGDYPGRLTFSTCADGSSSPTERMRISANGYIHMGPSAPSPGNTETLRVQTKDATSRALVCRTSNNSFTTLSLVQFLDGDSNSCGEIIINAVANTTNYSTSSDYRLKENIGTISDALSRLKALNPCNFNFISAPDIRFDGFLAHEVQDIVPEAITGEKDAVDDEGKPVYQGIDQSKLVPLLTAALQEAIGEIESLKARVTALETP